MPERRGRDLSRCPHVEDRPGRRAVEEVRILHDWRAEDNSWETTAFTEEEAAQE